LRIRTTEWWRPAATTRAENQYIVATAVFVLYDIMVERRQKLVLSTATNSSAIVASLFPSKVRAALMKEQEEKERAALVEPPTKHKLTTFLTEDHDENAAGQGSAVASGTLYASKPLAELYPDTTVFFGDIAGFTAWSKSCPSFDAARYMNDT
jgi:hypothetical protein